jgi:hypothetical protein
MSDIAAPPTGSVAMPFEQYLFEHGLIDEPVFRRFREENEHYQQFQIPPK